MGSSHGVASSQSGRASRASSLDVTKDGRRAEARTRMVPIGLGRPELRFYVSSRETGELMLLWSQVFTDGRQVGEFAEAKEKEFVAMGWRE
jgi:hypothetical protein